MKTKPVGTLMRHFPRSNKHFTSPNGILTGTFGELMEAGCIQAELPSQEPMYVALFAGLHGRVCDECPVWENHGPECLAFQQYHTAFAGLLKSIKLETRQRAIKTRPRCPKCRRRIRGANHNDHCKG